MLERHNYDDELMLQHTSITPPVKVNTGKSARFVEPQTLLAADDLPPFIRAYLEEAARAASARPPGPDRTAVTRYERS